MYNDKEYSAKLLASDKKLDLALLKVDLKNKGYLKFSYDPKKMQKVYAAGYPLGKFLSDDLKFTDGIVSSLKGFEDNTNQIQISAAINPGNSGGPVMDKNGNVVGVAVALMSAEAGQNIFFAVKSSTLKTFASSNGLSFLPPNNRPMSNKDLGQLITEGTLFLECWRYKFKHCRKSDHTTEIICYSDLEI